MINTVWSDKEEEKATARLGSIDVGDFSNTIYDFFTGDQTGVNFITNIGLQVPLFLQEQPKPKTFQETKIFAVGI